MAMGGRVQAVHIEGDGVERHGRFRSSITVVPQPGRGIEPVPRQQLPALIRHEIHRIQDEGEHRLGQEIREVHADPAGLDALAPEGDLLLELARRGDVDAEQAMSVWTGARAAPARLDPEEIVQERHHEVVMQIAAPCRTTNDTIDSRGQVVTAEHLDRRVRPPTDAAPGA